MYDHNNIKNLVRRIMRYRQSLSVSYKDMTPNQIKSIAMNDKVNCIVKNDYAKWLKRFDDISKLANINPIPDESIRLVQGGLNSKNCIFCNNHRHTNDCIWVFAYIYYCTFKFKYTDKRYCKKCLVQIWLHNKDERGNWIIHNYSNGQPHKHYMQKENDISREDIYSDYDDYTYDRY